MTETLTIVGRVATDPVRSQLPGGEGVTNFRVASSHRRFDAATQSWIDVDTNWFSVAAFRQLGDHVKASLRCGDSVIVTGRLKIRNWESNGKSGTSVDIDAEAVGHDLRWGTTAYLRSSRSGSGESPARPNSEPSHDSGRESAHAPDQTEEIEDAEDPLDLSTAWDPVGGLTEQPTFPH